GFVLLNMNKTDEARALAARMLAGARTPQEMQSAHSFQEAVEGRAEMSTRLASSSEQEADDADAPEPAKLSTPAKETVEAAAPTEMKKSDERMPIAHHDSTEPEAPVNITQNRVYEMTGKITLLDCAQSPEITLTLAMSSIEMKLHTGDVAKVAVKDSSRPARAASAGCATWKTRSAKMSYHLTPGTNYDGEIISIQLF
ncbi:MAG: hypothetical protein ACRD36_09455, partial [Candidatus Acidiferrum sp.]